MSREIKNDQNYGEKLLRLIPSEIVATYLIISGIIPEDVTKWAYLIVSSIILLIIPFYLWRIQNVKNILQIISTSIAFIVWIYSFNGGPFNSCGLYKPWIASIILILWTVIMPILVPPNKEAKEQKAVIMEKPDKINNTKKAKTTNKKTIKKLY